MENTTQSVLVDEKVTVRPIQRPSDWLPENHDSAFMNEGASWTLCVPIRGDRKVLADPLHDLNPTQKQELAEALGLENVNRLNVYRPDNYFKGWELRIDRNGKKLDLTDPYDFVTYKILLSNTEWIAPTWEMRNLKQTYKYALQLDSEKLTTEISEVNKKERSYVALSKMSDNRQMMSDFMWALYLQVKTAQRPPVDAPLEWLKKEIGKVIDNDPNLFLSIVEDSDYPFKVLIMKSLNVGALARVGDTYRFPHSEETIGGLINMVAHLKDPRYQEDLLKLKTQIEIAEQQTLDKSVGSLETIEEVKKMVQTPTVEPSGESKPPDAGGVILPEDIGGVKEGAHLKDVHPDANKEESGEPEQSGEPVDGDVLQESSGSTETDGSPQQGPQDVGSQNLLDNDVPGAGPGPIDIPSDSTGTQSEKPPE